MQKRDKLEPLSRQKCYSHEIFRPVQVAVSLYCLAGEDAVKDLRVTSMAHFKRQRNILVSLANPNTDST